MQKHKKDYLVNYSCLTFVLIVKKRDMTFQKGIELYKAGEFESALEVFNQLISNSEKTPELHLYRGRILSRLGKTSEAILDFDLIVELDPYNTNYISDRAVVLHLLNRNDEALAEFDRAANLDPKNPYRYSSRAYFKDRIGDLNGSIEDYDKAIALDPEDAVSFNNKGLVEEKLGYKERSKKSFEKADDLVGYKPQDQKEDQPKPPLEKVEPIVNDEEDLEKELTFGHFLQTIKGLVTDPKTRKEFKEFIKNLFGRNKL
ncbi:TPR repeat protein [Algoriphagus machipongonensis]|uniref:TPR repeat protein n=2 Tax=Algoriphagus machipongonensis TaxID=388413 RepID=A3HTF7_9BACT|nr:TPR repeat protein [Algoriphagus machipongonensis]